MENQDIAMEQLLTGGKRLKFHICSSLIVALLLIAGYLRILNAEGTTQSVLLCGLWGRWFIACITFDLPAPELASRERS